VPHEILSVSAKLVERATTEELARFVCSDCGRVCRSYTQLSWHIRDAHPGDLDAAAHAVLDRDAHRVADQQAEQPQREHERREARRKPGEPRVSPRPPLPPPYFADIQLGALFGNMRTFRWYAHQELIGTSNHDAPSAIAREQEDTVGSLQPLLIDARRGLSPMRAVVDGLLDKLGLRFHTVTIEVELTPGEPPVAVVMHYRKLDAMARFLFRFVTPEHCRPRRLVERSSGDRVYADPYSGDVLLELCGAIQARDPSAIAFALKLYWDDTNLTKNGERSACPVSVTSLALPLEQARQPSNGMLLSYLSKVPDRAMLEVSDARKTTVRKLLFRAQMRHLFSGMRDRSMISLVGTTAVGAHGQAERIYPVVLGLSLDYPKIAQVTQTLQNQACWMCYARKGPGFWSHESFDLRSNATQRAHIGRAWALHPHSAAARADHTRPLGLHPDPNPAFEVVGLDVFQGTAIPLMHFCEHGTGQKLMECTFQLMQSSLSSRDFKALGKQIDAWITARVVPLHMTKCAFSRGISHYLYGAYINPLDPWEGTVKFGQIASADTLRDILRFWRLLLVDISPGCPQLLELFTVYFEWLELMYRRAHTDGSLRYASDLNEQWQDLAISLFGKEHFEDSIKFHAAGAHLADWTTGRGSLLYYNDAYGELLNKSNAKEPWRRTNYHRGPHGAEEQMTTVVSRTDLLKLLLQLAERADASPAPPPPLASPQLGPPSRLMGVRETVCRIDLGAAQNIHPSLLQLPFSVALYLHQATGGGSDDASFPGGMPSLTSSLLEVRPGVAVQRWPANFRAAERGGSKLHAALCQDETRQEVRPTGEAPVFVAVDVDGQGKLWYGQLILCFIARYLGPEQLCYIRWLDSLHDLDAARIRPLTPREAVGPFEAFRWSKRPGSRRHRGHPRANSPHYGVVSCEQVRYRAAIIASLADALDAEDPLFRLNTDMYLL
jgi:hypothetical protein